MLFMAEICSSKCVYYINHTYNSVTTVVIRDGNGQKLHNMTQHCFDSAILYCNVIMVITVKY